MIKWVAVGMLLLASMVLVNLLIRNSKYRVSLKRITLHWIFAAFLLFMLHTNDVTSALAVPMTPFSLSIIAILGIPGLALVQGVYILI